MEYIMENTILPWLKMEYQLNEVLVTRVIHLAGVGESLIDGVVLNLKTKSLNLLIIRSSR